MHLPLLQSYFFFFNDTATTEIYTLSLHDALPISTSFQIVAQISTPTVGTTPTQQTSSLSNPINTSRPVLAFYYPWYTSSTWCSCHMSDLPTILYNSSDNTTIARQVTNAADAGITGFISPCWGSGDQTD